MMNGFKICMTTIHKYAHIVGGLLAEVTIYDRLNELHVLYDEIPGST